MMVKLLQSPRATFIENPENIRKHRELLQQPELKAAFEVALATMTKGIISLSRGADMLTPGRDKAAQDSFFIIQGAHEFIEVFYRLAELDTRPPAPRKSPDALDHHN